MLRLTTIFPVSGYTSINSSLAFFCPSSFPCLEGSSSAFFGRPATPNSISMWFAMRMAHFTSHIIQIIFSRTKKQMIRVYTSFNITRMANTHIVRDNTTENHPRYSMGIHSLPLVVGLAVSLRTFSTSEYPALISLFDGFLHHAINSWTWLRSRFHNTIIPKIPDAS